MGIWLNATVFNTTRGYKVPANTPISDVKVDLTQTKQIMVDVSTFTADSAFLTAHDSGIFDINITQKLAGPLG